MVVAHIITNMNTVASLRALYLVRTTSAIQPISGNSMSDVPMQISVGKLGWTTRVLIDVICVILYENYIDDESNDDHSYNSLWFHG